MITKRLICAALNAALCASAAALIGCSQQPSSTTSPPTAASTSPAPASTVGQTQPYTPPTAEQLYQLVAPIALFPDKLVAQVLAGSTYPNEVTAADAYLAQNTNLQGSALQDQVDQQSWDPGVKGLTAFPKVLDQMAQNIPWTTSLGEAYVNDPTDVMNAIQVMRQRASQHGSLRNSAQLQVVEQPVAQSDSDTEVANDYPPAYAGPDMVPAPQREIEILPANPDTVYVPEYDPQTVYGEELSPYPGYRYEPQGYSAGQMVATGAIAFGVGIVVASLFEHSHQRERPSYGWNSWGMNWGGHRGGGGDGGDGGDRGYTGWQRPAVVHNNTTYVSNSTTIVNRYVTNNVSNRVYDNNTSNRVRASSNPRNMLAPAPAGNVAAREDLARPPVAVERKPMRAPDFHGALTPGEPSRFTRASSLAPVSPRMQPNARVAAQPASHQVTEPRFASGTATSMHPVPPATPAEAARPRMLPQPPSRSRSLAQSSEHAAPAHLPAERAAAAAPRPIRSVESAPSAPRTMRPVESDVRAARPIRPVESAAQAPRTVRPVESATPAPRPPVTSVQPPRSQSEVERRVVPRHQEAPPAAHETPRAQTPPHQSARPPVNEPRKEVPKDAKKRDKQDDQGH